MPVGSSGALTAASRQLAATGRRRSGRRARPTTPRRGRGSPTRPPASWGSSGRTSRSFSSSVTRPCLSSVTRVAEWASARWRLREISLVADLAHHVAGHLLEGVAGDHVDAAVLADDQVAGVAEEGPERRRQGEAALVVELAFVDPDEHRAKHRTFLARSPVGCLVRGPGPSPPSPTLAPDSPLCQPFTPTEPHHLPRPPPSSVRTRSASPDKSPRDSRGEVERGNRFSRAPAPGGRRRGRGARAGTSRPGRDRPRSRQDVGDGDGQLAGHEGLAVGGDAAGGVAVHPDRERVAPPRRAGDDDRAGRLAPTRRAPQLDALGHGRCVSARRRRAAPRPACGGPTRPRAPPPPSPRPGRRPWRRRQRAGRR